jgi:hypothetical protein
MCTLNKEHACDMVHLAAVRVSGVTKCICSDRTMASSIIWDRSPNQASRPGTCLFLMMVLQPCRCSRRYARARGGCGVERVEMRIWHVQCSRRPCRPWFKSIACTIPGKRCNRSMLATMRCEDSTVGLNKRRPEWTEFQCWIAKMLAQPLVQSSSALSMSSRSVEVRM